MENRKRIEFYIAAETATAIEKAAKQQQISVSHFLRVAAIKELKKWNSANTSKN